MKFEVFFPFLLWIVISSSSEVDAARTLLMNCVCFFVLCKRHWFNRVPGAHRGECLCLPLTLTLTLVMSARTPLPTAVTHGYLHPARPGGTLHQPASSMTDTDTDTEPLTPRNTGDLRARGGHGVFPSQVQVLCEIFNFTFIFYF